jgi:hypothetical protein
MKVKSKKEKGKRVFAGALLATVILAAGIFMTGCGGTTSYSYFYGNSSWTVDGNLIFIKVLQTTTKDILGSQTGSTITDGVAIMSAAGASETFQFDVTADLPYSMSCAPTTATTQYVAYLNNLDATTHLYGGILVRSLSSGQKLNTVQLSFTPGIRSFDWSNTGTQLVYCTTSEVHTINLDGTGDTPIVTGLTNVTSVTWKYGTKVAYVHTVGSDTVLSLMNANGTGSAQDLAPAASVDKPQISSANNSLIYGLAGGSLCSVDVSAGTPATTEVKASFRGSLPRLDPTGAKVTYDKLSLEDSGIYVLDLATKVETKIK